MATLYAKTAGGNWSAAGTWSNVNAGGADNSGPPTAADNVIFELLSGNVTIDAAASCRGLDTTSGTGTYTGTITHNATFALSIGDATSAAGNVALKFNSSMTYTLGSTTTSSISFLTTSATQQTVTWGGKSSGNTTFNATSNGNWAITDNWTTNASATHTLTKGTIHYDGTADNSALTHTLGNFTGNASTQTIYYGAANITFAGTSYQIGAAGNITMNAGTSSLTMSGAGFLFQTGSLTFYDVSLTGSGTPSVDASGGVVTFHNFTRTGTAVKTDGLQFNYSSGSTGYTATNQWNLNGNSATNRLFVKSGIIGSAPKFTHAGATINITNADFRDINAQSALDLSGITGNSGNCLGNTNITFTTATTQYYNTAVSANWSDSTKWFLGTNGTGGAGRVPLPQDDVIFDANSVTAGSKTITCDMPRAGKSLDCTGLANSPTFAWASVGSTFFGSITLVSGMTNTQTASIGLGMQARSSVNITTNGCTTTPSFTQDMTSAGTLTLQDALSSSLAGYWVINSGALNTNNFNFAAGSITAGSGTTLTITNSTLTIGNIGQGTQVLTNSGATVNAANSTINLTASNATRTFAGGGKTFNNLNISIGGTVNLNFTGNNTFNVVNFKSTGAQVMTLTFASGSITTMNQLIVNGKPSLRYSIGPTTAGAKYYFKSGGNIENRLRYCDISYCEIKDSPERGLWKAFGSDGNKDNGRNRGWLFYEPKVWARMVPATSAGGSGNLMLMGVG